MIRFSFLLYFTVFLLMNGAAQAASPYPKSKTIEGITWDFAGLKRQAPGSDLWPVTWGVDGNLYTSWGDGGGFGGTNGDGRVSLGFARINGSPANFTTANVWGGKNPENRASFAGKATGMLSVNGILYAWMVPDDIFTPVKMRVAYSLDTGKTWTKVAWTFGETDTLRDITFLNFGQDNAGARDEFVYSYALERGGPTEPTDACFPGDLHLLRVPNGHNLIINRSLYEFFAGLDAGGKPIWTRDVNQRKPVFSDPNGTGHPSVAFNSGLNRYLLTIAHGCNVAANNVIRKLGVFDSAEPWGPWTTVEYNENWGGYTGYWLGYHMPTKTPDWMSVDGKVFHLMFSGSGVFDSFNLIKGTLNLINGGGGGDTTPPGQVQGLDGVPLP